MIVRLNMPDTQFWYLYWQFTTNRLLGSSRHTYVKNYLYKHYKQKERRRKERRERKKQTHISRMQCIVHTNNGFTSLEKQSQPQWLRKIENSFNGLEVIAISTSTAQKKNIFTTSTAQKYIAISTSTAQIIITSSQLLQLRQICKKIFKYNI